LSDVFEKFSIGLLQKIMSREWLLAALLIISFFDMYLNLRLGFSLSLLSDGQKNIGWFNIIEAGIIFSFIYAVIVPIIQGIYFLVILPILSKFGIYMNVNENTDYTKSLYRLKKKAVKEDNSVLWNAYQEEKSNSEKISFIFASAWGILIFSILGCFGESGKSILVSVYYILYEVSEKNYLMGLGIYFLLSIIGIWYFSILWLSLCLREDILPYWEDDRKSSS
jgi:hypothetical protein